MKWSILIISAVLMSGCYHSTDVVEYRQVMPTVQPVAVYTYPGVDVTATTIDWY
ncbi:hypothetical protein [Legionella longbeachae]|uniref:hypothetical protein n=1 Tax=Legionella longbeachae TaxID=450 RepID=UPI00155B2B59|nr:hypothetical protein [Legionella longbeachae]